MIKFNAVDFCQPSVIKVGGISEMIKILRLSEKNNKNFMPHTAYFGPGFLASLHVASLTNKETFIERFWLDLAEEFYPGFTKAKNGKYLLPDGHGLGYDIDEKLITKALNPFFLMMTCHDVLVASFLFLTYAIFSLFLNMKETAKRQGNFFSICLTRKNSCRSWRAREESNS